MPTFIRLTDYKDSDTKEQQFANPANRHTANQDDFSKIPGSPIAYWISPNMRKVFNNTKIEDYATLFQGIITGNNEKYVRYWQELSLNSLTLKANSVDDIDYSNGYWVPYNKGGESRNWYGNQEMVVNFKNQGRDFTRGKHQFFEYFFKPCFSWTYISSTTIATRYFPAGFIWDVHGSSAFPHDENNIFYFMALIASKPGYKFLQIINPTISFQVENIAVVPVINPNIDTKIQLISIVKQNINIAREEWDSRETSWDFTQNELIRHQTDDGKIASAFSAYCDYWRDKFTQLHANEEELNRLFIEIYGLQDELTPDVALEDITILKSESRIENGELVFNADEIARQFISYAVGCMFGRYTLDREGLVVANMGQDYPTDTPFAIDDDNIIPVLEEEVFADDIAARFERFVAVAFGEEKVAENLRWIEEALGMNIRKYFYGEFYKDHVRRYKKRPIYWLIQSPKKGFSALIYMHRYQSDTMARVQTMYLREYLTKLESLIEHYNTIASNPSSSAKDAKDAAKLASKLEGKHRDALDFDRGDMSRIAAEQITIDLDDGVKVNYQKFKGVLPDIGLSKGED